MTEFDIEYGDVYSSMQKIIPRKTSLEKRTFQQNFLCKIVKHTGEYFTISNSPYESISDLYLKVERNLTTGFSFGLMSEYSIESKPDISGNVEDKVHDLFVQNLKTKNLKSIPRTDKIRLFDYIQQNPDYFVADENLHIFKTYAIYLADNAAMEYAKTVKSEKQFWEKLLETVYRHVSCFNQKNGNKLLR
jgi:hypothetical protein